WIATVWVSVPLGTTTVLEPGGGPLAPVCETAATEQGGTMTVRSLCCLGTTTVRTPGICSAVETASEDEEPPQPVTSSVIATAPPARTSPASTLLIASSPLSCAVRFRDTAASTPRRRGTNDPGGRAPPEPDRRARMGHHAGFGGA